MKLEICSTASSFASALSIICTRTLPRITPSTRCLILATVSTSPMPKPRATEDGCGPDLPDEAFQILRELLSNTGNPFGGNGIDEPSGPRDHLGDSFPRSWRNQGNKVKGTAFVLKGLLKLSPFFQRQIWNDQPCHSAAAHLAIKSPMPY